MTDSYRALPTEVGAQRIHGLLGLAQLAPRQLTLHKGQGDIVITHHPGNLLGNVRLLDDVVAETGNLNREPALAHLVGISRLFRISAHPLRRTSTPQGC